MSDRYETIISQVKREIDEKSVLSDKYSDFLFAYLNQTGKNKVKITIVTLHLNDLKPDIDQFIDNLWVNDVGFTKIKKRRKNYAIFKLTKKGKMVRDTFEYDHLVIKRNYVYRFAFGIYFFIQFWKKLIFQTIPNFLNRVFSIKSGKIIMKIIVTLGAISALIVSCFEIYDRFIK